VPLYYVAKLARENDTIVVQIGEGADELLHGYEVYIEAARLRRRYWAPLQRLPRPVRLAAAHATASAARLAGRDFAAVFAADAAAGRQPFWGGFIAWQGDLKDQITTNGHDDSYAIVDRFWRAAERERPGADLLQKMTYLELKNRLAELLLMRVDKMLMATSVEGREPFLDHHLVEFAMALPPEQKVRGGVGKYILKRAVEDLLPHDLIYREKQGFGAPVSEWFRGELGERAQREIRNSSLAERGLIDLDRVDQMWTAHRGGRNYALQLWNLYNVSAWHDHWIARRPVG
jgi:asparagine synthase (glutamine-hydrolysing)